MARMASLEEAGRSFDLDFWGKVGHEGRFAAAWEMVIETFLLRGEDAGQLRLRRSVQGVERR